MSGVSSTLSPDDLCPMLAQFLGAGGMTPGTQEWVLGKDDYGCEFKLFGATSGAYMLWDESADDLILAGAACLVFSGTVKAARSGVFGTPVEWDGADEWIELHVGNISATSSKPAFRLRLNPTIAQTTGQACAMQVQAYGEATGAQNVYSLLGGNFEAGFKAACELLTGGSAVALRCKVEDLGNDITVTGKVSALQVAGQFSSGTTMTGVYSLIEFVHEGNIGADTVFYFGPAGGMFQECEYFLKTVVSAQAEDGAFWLTATDLHESDDSSNVQNTYALRVDINGTEGWIPIYIHKDD